MRFDKEKTKRLIASKGMSLDRLARWRICHISDLLMAYDADTVKLKLEMAEEDFPEWESGRTEAELSSLLVPMANVEAKRAQYLIAPYLPRGMLSIIGGISGVGKTYLILSFAAAISKGERLPFQNPFEPAPPSGYVYYFTQENDPNTVIRPRLDVLGANLDKVLIQAQSGTTCDPLTMNDPRLEEAAKVYPPALVIFDPIQSYLGAAVEMNKANEVRPILPGSKLLLRAHVDLDSVSDGLGLLLRLLDQELQGFQVAGLCRQFVIAHGVGLLLKNSGASCGFFGVYAFRGIPIAFRALAHSVGV